jgi:lysine 2,3-aminomutase
VGIITSLEELPPEFAKRITDEEKIFLNKLKEARKLPFAVTEHFLSLASPFPDDPIRKQFFPDPREALPDPFENNDPLGESLHRVTPRLVHQYQDRALLLAARACAGYCRYCFRRVWLGRMGKDEKNEKKNFIAEAELEPALAYLSAHTEIREILVSGGDPLTGTDETLEKLFAALRKARPGILIRLCTRRIITDPDRISRQTIAMLKKFRPLRIIAHINHARELSPSARCVLSACVEAGIPVHTQTVLLRGVNDKAETLAELFRACLDIGITPYYLFQLDLAPGIAHFRTSLKEGLAIYRELKTLISGLGLPVYALDLPGGRGKTALTTADILRETDSSNGKAYLLQGEGNPIYPVF